VAEHVYRMPKKAALEWHLVDEWRVWLTAVAYSPDADWGEGRLQSVVHVSRERLQTDGEEDRRQVADRVHLRDCGGFAIKLAIVISTVGPPCQGRHPLRHGRAPVPRT
jgi:hypothetical protein